METFWKTIALYNENTWVAQIVITLVGIVLTVLLYKKPCVRVKRSMKIYLIFLSLWISVVYYLIYSSSRNYHYVLAIFWAIMALLWIWDLLTDYTTFERNPRRYRFPMIVLYLIPFLYPVLSWARGMEFPEMTTTVMPCSVAVFTIGLLCSFSKKVNMLVLLLLFHWAIISFSKIQSYRIPEDILLASATIPAIYLFFRNYIDQHMDKDTKPSARFMNCFLTVICIIIGIFLCITLYNLYLFKGI